MKKRFFTLVEILVACGIIAILAGMGFAGYRYAMNSGRINSTKGITGQISTALESCYNKFGFYPNSSAFESITITLDGDIPDTIKFGSVSYDKDDTAVLRKQFFSHFFSLVDAESLKAARGQDGVLIDSWGNTIYYRYPGKENKKKFDIVSAGPDGTFGTEKSEKPGDSTTFLDGKEMACDDIGNF